MPASFSLRVPDDKDDTSSSVSWQGSHSLPSVSARIQSAPVPSHSFAVEPTDRGSRKLVSTARRLSIPAANSVPASSEDQTAREEAGGAADAEVQAGMPKTTGAQAPALTAVRAGAPLLFSSPPPVPTPGSASRFPV